MSRKTEIYNHYLEQWYKDHSNIINPICYGGFSNKKFSEIDFSNSEIIVPENVGGEKVLQLSNGKVVQIKYVGMTRIPLAKVWPNKEAWQNYCEPLSSNIYWN